MMDYPKCTDYTKKKYIFQIQFSNRIEDKHLITFFARKNYTSKIKQTIIE